MGQGAEMFSVHLNIDLRVEQSKYFLNFRSPAERATESGCFIKCSWLITTNLRELTDKKA